MAPRAHFGSENESLKGLRSLLCVCVCVCVRARVCESDPRFTQFTLGSYCAVHINALSIELILSYSSIWNQNVPQEIPFFIRNKYSAIARKRSNTTAIIV